MTKRFYQIEIGTKFELAKGGRAIYTKVDQSTGRHRNGWNRHINSQAAVIVIEDEKPWRELDFHTFEFTERQLADVINEIIGRAVDTYGEDRVDADRLRKGLYAAHRAKPIRLIALLHACALDFPADVLYGVYRHYDPKTDSIKGGWTAQHAEPHAPDMWERLMRSLGYNDDEEDE